MTRILTIIALLFATPMLAACTIGPTKSDISESGRLIYSAKVENFDIPKFFDCLRYRGGNLKLKAGLLTQTGDNYSPFKKMEVGWLFFPVMANRGALPVYPSHRKTLSAYNNKIVIGV
jgi:hypothetical protein